MNEHSLTDLLNQAEGDTLDLAALVAIMDRLVAEVERAIHDDHGVKHMKKVLPWAAIAYTMGELYSTTDRLVKTVDQISDKVQPPKRTASGSQAMG